MTSTNTCEFCGKPLEPREAVLCGKKRTFGFKPCECEGAIQEAYRRECEREERNRKEEREAKTKRYFDAGIPPKFARLEDMSIEEKTAADAIESGLYLWGKPGRGKTWQACAIARYAVDRGFKVCFISAVDMFDSLTKFDQENLAKFVKADILVIDDLGAEKPTEYKLEKLVQVIDARELNEKSTIITSNLDLVTKQGECLAKQWSPIGSIATQRLISRLKAYPKVYLDGVDRRLA